MTMNHKYDIEKVQIQSPLPHRCRRRRIYIRLVIGLLSIWCSILYTKSVLIQNLDEKIFWRLQDNLPKPFQFTPDQQARRILKSHPLIDGHNDLMIFIRDAYKNRIYDDEFIKLFENGGLNMQEDIPRIKSGQMGGAFWSVFMPCPENSTDYSDNNYSKSVKSTIEQLDLYQRLAQKYPKYFTPVSSNTEAKINFSRGKLISPAGVEGLHQIGNSVSTLRLFHEMGAKYVTLTWNCHNIYADAALTAQNGTFAPSKPLHGGISEKGRDLVREMNRLGMMVDLSHVSKDTMIDALSGSNKWGGWKGSIAPPIFSHSSAYGVCPHPRNVQDDVLQMVKERNSIVMINFGADFISCKPSDNKDELPITEPQHADIKQVVRHIKYIGELIGYDHIGIGSDFDGIDRPPKGLEDVSKFPKLIAELIKDGIDRHDIIKIIGGNILRVWQEVDAISNMFKRIQQPLEDDIKF